MSPLRYTPLLFQSRKIFPRQSSPSQLSHALVTQITRILKQTIADAPMSLSEIARRANLSKNQYLGLWRWIKGKKSDLDVQIAEEVYFAITGNRFVSK